MTELQSSPAGPGPVMPVARQFKKRSRGKFRLGILRVYPQPAPCRGLKRVDPRTVMSPKL